MSALPPIADMCSATRHVRFVPIADIEIEPGIGVCDLPGNSRVLFPGCSFLI
jgi:hypothetical protein